MRQQDIRALGLLVLLSAPALSAQRAVPTVPDLSSMGLEQLMKLEVVFAGSKRSQQTRDVPSFVSVVTAAEIKEHGYRTLADVLQTLASFYVTNDRNFSFLGVRGFDRSGDYSSRVLLLLNGLRTNDNIFGGAVTGEEFLVDVELIDRIEVIRGPSAAIYGSNAFFAVINVVTKQGRNVQGGELSATSASYGTRAGRATYGNVFDNGLDVLASASVSSSDGQRLYYPEFDSPSTNNGVADKIDGESLRKFFASASLGDFSLQASNFSRTKGIPTASYGTTFNDGRTNTITGLSLASLSYNRAFSDATSLAARVHAGRWTYFGSYAYEASRPPNHDEDLGEWWGADVDARRAFARQMLTVGAELQDNTAQNQRNYDSDPFFVNVDATDKSLRYGLFAQDEITLIDPLRLYAGARYDHYATFGAAFSPRVGLIFTPNDRTTVKLLAGRAFRAPNESELFLKGNGYDENPRLQPERIETLELLAQRLVGGGLQFSASAFRNRLSALISQTVNPVDSNFIYQNASAIESRGIELGVEVNRGHGLTGELNYTLQRTNDRATGIELSNSPRQMLKGMLRAPLFAGITTAMDAQYMSNRTTLAGRMNDGHIVTNLSALAPRAFGRIDLSATAYNLFNVAYAIPGAAEHVQDVIPQDGRNFRVKVTLHLDGNPRL